jgi:hypothetical protein
VVVFDSKSSTKFRSATLTGTIRRTGTGTPFTRVPAAFPLTPCPLLNVRTVRAERTLQGFF